MGVLFEWWRARRRSELLERPFPAAWRALMKRNVGYLRYLGDAERKQLEDLVQVFLAEKHFEGCGGLVLTEWPLILTT